jgi:Zn-dependent protease with chaperone function
MRLEGGCARPSNNYSDTAHADMWISNPLRNEGMFRNLFSTHPSTESRVERLEALARKMKDKEVPEYTPEEDSSRSKLNFQ